MTSDNSVRVIEYTFDKLHSGMKINLNQMGIVSCSTVVEEP